MPLIYMNANHDNENISCYIVTKFHISPWILGFEMEKNIIKLQISGSAHYVLLYYL